MADGEFRSTPSQSNPNVYKSRSGVEVSYELQQDPRRSNTFGGQYFAITSGQAHGDEAQILPLGGCIKEELELHEVWILETNSVGIRHDILNVSAAEQTPREGPIVFVTGKLESICGKLTGYAAYYILSRGVTPGMAGCSLLAHFLLGSALSQHILWSLAKMY